MSEDDLSFFDYLERRHVRLDYAIDDFLYGHEGPCPQVARDHPFGQAPEVLNIPEAEWSDWKAQVGHYYLKNMAHFAEEASAYALERFAESGLLGYPHVSDDDFTELLSEGLYSKFLCSTLDAADEKRFARFLGEPGRFDYLKSDYSCMRVIESPWPGEYVAPAVVLLRKPKGDPYGYEVVAIALARWDADQGAFIDLPEPLTPADGETWRLAKYFVLQGAIHRINLIDHTEVHFPPDAINAITKTILPTRNLVFQLLLPHLWLTLPVNNTVLEGDRSIINRNSWYPWSPFVAKGDEVRKLLPFGWYGGRCTWSEENSAYPPYRFRPEPPPLPSRYGAFFAAYHEPIRAFVRTVVEALPPDDETHTDWVEIQSWAHQIGSWLPGFPSWRAFTYRNESERRQALDTLADTLAAIILNVSVIHSSDHATLHKMMTEKAVPFVLRVAPPTSRSAAVAPPAELQTLAQRLKARVEGALHEVEERLTMLCRPTDLMYARMADLLFYMPHNSSLLIDCNYAFKSAGGPLAKAVADFQDGLRQVDRAQRAVSQRYGFPALEPPPELTGAERETFRERSCIGAGIQY